LPAYGSKYIHKKHRFSARKAVYHDAKHGLSEAKRRPFARQDKVKRQAVSYIMNQDRRPEVHVKNIKYDRKNILHINKP
jgi:hypothetical protein